MAKAEKKVGLGAVAGYFALAVILTIATWAVDRVTKLGHYGVEFPLVGFLLGLAVSASLKPPREVFTKLNPWVFVDASLIILGMLMGFNKLAALDGKAGVIAVLNLAVGLSVGFYVAYRLGVDERFAATFVAGGSVCGISAAIATGRAANAEFPHLVIAMLLIAIVGSPFAIAAAVAAHHLGHVGGALVGGVVDGTPVVRAIAEGLPKDMAEVATAVKYAQNCLIPIVAIVLAYVASRLGGYEARLPLAVLLMLLASIIASFVTLPESVSTHLHAARNWLLALAMVLAGMATPLEALRKPGVKAAILAFIAIEVANIIVVYTAASLLHV